VKCLVILLGSSTCKEECSGVRRGKEILNKLEKLDGEASCRGKGRGSTTTVSRGRVVVLSWRSHSEGMTSNRAFTAGAGRVSRVWEGSTRRWDISQVANEATMGSGPRLLIGGRRGPVLGQRFVMEIDAREVKR
jgi:hypothetical protein